MRNNNDKIDHKYLYKRKFVLDNNHIKNQKCIRMLSFNFPLMYIDNTVLCIFDINHKNFLCSIPYKNYKYRT